MFGRKRIKELESEKTALQATISVLEKEVEKIPDCKCLRCQNVAKPNYKVQGVNQFKDRRRVVFVCPICGSTNLTIVTGEDA